MKAKLNNEYKREVFMFTLNEGGEFKDIKYRHFSDAAITGDMKPGKNITFFAEVIGFHDSKAPMRDWGMGIKGFMRRCLRKRP